MPPTWNFLTASSWLVGFLSGCHCTASVPGPALQMSSYEWRDDLNLNLDTLS